MASFKLHSVIFPVSAACLWKTKIELNIRFLCEMTIFLSQWNLIATALRFFVLEILQDFWTFNFRIYQNRKSFVTRHYSYQMSYVSRQHWFYQIKQPRLLMIYIFTSINYSKLLESFIHRHTSLYKIAPLKISDCFFSNKSLKWSKSRSNTRVLCMQYSLTFQWVFPKTERKKTTNVNRFKGPEFWLLWVKLNLLGVCLVT